MLEHAAGPGLGGRLGGVTVTSTAVVPFYRVSRHRLTWSEIVTYRCRTCGSTYEFNQKATRAVRMMLLAKHLVDAHQTGPLAVMHVDEDLE